MGKTYELAQIRRALQLCTVNGKISRMSVLTILSPFSDEQISSFSMELEAKGKDLYRAEDIRDYLYDLLDIMQVENE